MLLTNPETNMNTGFFTIEDTHEVLKCANLPEAKQFASALVTAFQQKAQARNIEK